MALCSRNIAHPYVHQYVYMYIYIYAVVCVVTWMGASVYTSCTPMKYVVSSIYIHAPGYISMHRVERYVHLSSYLLLKQIMYTTCECFSIHIAIRKHRKMGIKYTCSIHKKRCVDCFHTPMQRFVIGDIREAFNTKDLTLCSSARATQPLKRKRQVHQPSSCAASSGSTRLTWLSRNGKEHPKPSFRILSMKEYKDQLCKKPQTLNHKC